MKHFQNDVPGGNIENIANKVFDVVQDYNVQKRFQEKTCKWQVWRAEQIKTQNEWRQRRIEHFQKAGTDLTDRDGGPPVDGWEYEFCRYPEQDRLVGKYAWCPPDLVHDKEPLVLDLLEFSELLDADLPAIDDRPLTSLEKYALLAAVHDVYCLGTKKINPWDAVSQDEGTSDPMQLLSRVAYDELCRIIASIRKPRVSVLERVLTRIIEDLRKNNLVGDFNETNNKGLCEEVCVPGDRPTDNGYVELPSEPESYIAFHIVLTDYAPMGTSRKQLKRIIEDYENNRIRWTRPPTKKGTPNPKALSINLPDYHAYLKRQEATRIDSDGFPIQSEEITEQRKKALDASKRRYG